MVNLLLSIQLCFFWRHYASWFLSCSVCNSSSMVISFWSGEDIFYFAPCLHHLLSFFSWVMHWSSSQFTCTFITCKLPCRDSMILLLMCCLFSRSQCIGWICLTNSVSLMNWLELRVWDQKYTSFSSLRSSLLHPFSSHTPLHLMVLLLVHMVHPLVPALLVIIHLYNLCFFCWFIWFIPWFLFWFFNFWSVCWHTFQLLFSWFKYFINWHLFWFWFFKLWPIIVGSFFSINWFLFWFFKLWPLLVHTLVHQLIEESLHLLLAVVPIFFFGFNINFPSDIAMMIVSTLD